MGSWSTHLVDGKGLREPELLEHLGISINLWSPYLLFVNCINNGWFDFWNSCTEIVVLPWPSFHLFQEISHLWFVWCGTCGKRTSNQRDLCYNATGWSFWEQRGSNPSEFKHPLDVCFPGSLLDVQNAPKQISREIETSKNATNTQIHTRIKLIYGGTV